MDEEEPEPSRRGALVAFVVIVAAVLVMIYVMQRLHQAAVIQDCVMSGRTNCARIDTAPR
jgi:hypothetical protein